MISRCLCVCLLLCACRIEKDRSAVPAPTAWVVDDDARSPAGGQMFSLRRDGAFTMQPGQSSARPQLSLTCAVAYPIVARVLLPASFVPPIPSDSARVMVRWQTDEGSPVHAGPWLVVRTGGDSLVAVQSPPGLARQIRAARTLTFAFVHPPRREEVSFELGGLSDYLAQAAATCHLDPKTLAPLAPSTSTRPAR